MILKVVISTDKEKDKPTMNGKLAKNFIAECVNENAHHDWHISAVRVRKGLEE